jgi:hypothetical protein
MKLNDTLKDEIQQAGYSQFDTLDPTEVVNIFSAIEITEDMSDEFIAGIAYALNQEQSG